MKEFTSLKLKSLLESDEKVRALYREYIKTADPKERARLIRKFYPYYLGKAKKDTSKLKEEFSLKGYITDETHALYVQDFTNYGDYYLSSFEINNTKGERVGRVFLRYYLSGEETFWVGSYGSSSNIANFATEESLIKVVRKLFPRKRLSQVR